jgi:hypothetical protein
VVTRPVRIGLLVLGVGQGFSALFALFAPRAFFDDFPVSGAHWVSALAAAWIAERRLAIVALVVWLISAVPHLIFHIAHADQPGGAEGAASLATLAFNAGLPLVLLFLIRKENPHDPHRPGPG